MADLIYRQALLDRMEKRLYELRGLGGTFFDRHEGYDEAMCAILAAPAVESVEVVRCKDCVWKGLATHCIHPKNIRRGNGEANGYILTVSDNHFCSYGKRREDA